MKILKEFKEFISKGNVMSLAIGVIIGGAFTGIVNSLVGDIFMPLISLITGGTDFSSWVLTIGSGDNAAAIKYGNFIAAAINFLLIAIVIFSLMKLTSKVVKKKEEEKTTKKCPYCKSEISIDAVKCAFCASDVE